MKINNTKELIQEICKRQEGVGKGLNAREVGEVLRHFGDIFLESQDLAPLHILLKNARRRAKSKK